MQEAINATYANPNAQARKVPRIGEIPDIEEMMSYLVSQMNEMNVAYWADEGQAPIA